MKRLHIALHIVAISSYQLGQISPSTTGLLPYGTTSLRVTMLLTVVYLTMLTFPSIALLKKLYCQYCQGLSVLNPRVSCMLCRDDHPRIYCACEMMDRGTAPSNKLSNGLSLIMHTFPCQLHSQGLRVLNHKVYRKNHAVTVRSTLSFTLTCWMMGRGTALELTPTPWIFDLVNLLTRVANSTQVSPTHSTWWGFAISILGVPRRWLVESLELLGHG